MKALILVSALALATAFAPAAFAAGLITETITTSVSGAGSVSESGVSGGEHDGYSTATAENIGSASANTGHDNVNASSVNASTGTSYSINGGAGFTVGGESGAGMFSGTTSISLY